MKSFFTKISSLILASIVIFSTMSFSITTHHCNYNMLDTSMFGNLKTCTVGVEEPSGMQCDFVEIDTCCATNIILKEADNDLKKISLKKYVNTIVFLYTYNNLFVGLEENIIPFINYDPPLISKDFQVINETFLI